MENFSYRGYDNQGGKVQGSIKANTLEQARQTLNERQLMLLHVGKEDSANGQFGLSWRRRVSAQELEYLTSELALLLNSGVTIDRGLAVMKRNTSSAPQAKLIINLHDKVRRGETLTSAMAAEHEVFSPLYINLVKLGESSGTLPQIFERLAEDIKFQSELKRKIIQSLIYPMVILAVCILSIIFIFNYIVPQMSGLFEGLPEIPSYTAFLLGLSKWMIAYQWYALLAFFCFIFVLVGFLRTSMGARRMDSALICIPGVYRVLLSVESVRFNTAIAMMLSSGILIDRCLEMAVGSVNNSVLRQDLIIAKDRVKKGDILSTALGASPLYTDFSISLIEVGEESGGLEAVFIELSARARREFEGWVDRFTALLEPLLILVMGGIVGGVVVTMLLSIVAVNDIGF